MYSTKSKIMKERDVVYEIVNKLPALLPNVKIKKVSLETRLSNKTIADIIVQIEAGTLKKDIIIEVKSIGEPRLVQTSIYQLRRMGKTLPGSYPVFAAPYVSERSREICISEDIGYLDLLGDVYLKFDSVLIDRISNKEREAERRNTRGIFAPKATRVIRGLLKDSLTNKTISELAESCNMSPAGVYFVIKELENKGYVARERNKSIKLMEPRKLLMDWAANWTVEKNKASSFFSFAKEPEEIISNISEAGKRLNLNYAFTGMAGASLVSPFVRYNDVWVYVSGDKESLINKLDLRPVTSGANVVILDAYDEGVFTNARKIRGVNVVSDIQLFVDLYTYPSRGQEQAERLLEKVIKFEAN